MYYIVSFASAYAFFLFLSEQEHSVEVINISRVTKNNLYLPCIVERQGSFCDKSLSSR